MLFTNVFTPTVAAHAQLLSVSEEFSTSHVCLLMLALQMRRACTRFVGPVSSCLGHGWLNNLLVGCSILLSFTIHLIFLQMHCAGECYVSKHAKVHASSMEYHLCMWRHGCGVLPRCHCFQSSLFFLLWKGLGRKRCHVFVSGVHHCIINSMHAPWLCLQCASVSCATPWMLRCARFCLSKSGCLTIFDQCGIRMKGVHTQATATNKLQRSQCIGWLLRVFAWVVRLRVAAAGPLNGPTSGSTFRLVAAAGSRALLLSLRIPSGEW